MKFFIMDDQESDLLQKFAALGVQYCYLAKDLSKFPRAHHSRFRTIKLHKDTDIPASGVFLPICHLQHYKHCQPSETTKRKMALENADFAELWNKTYGDQSR
jgi:hypothetical protein